MAFSPNVWNQLKNVTADDLMSALARDRSVLDNTHGAVLVYVKRDAGGSRARVAIHYHPRKTYGPKLLRGLLDDIGWTESDLRRLKLIK